MKIIFIKINKYIFKTKMETSIQIKHIHYASHNDMTIRSA